MHGDGWAARGLGHIAEKRIDLLENAGAVRALVTNLTSEDRSCSYALFEIAKAKPDLLLEIDGIEERLIEGQYEVWDHYSRNRGMGVSCPSEERLLTLHLLGRLRSPSQGTRDRIANIVRRMTRFFRKKISAEIADVYPEYVKSNSLVSEYIATLSHYETGSYTQATGAARSFAKIAKAIPELVDISELRQAVEKSLTAETSDERRQMGDILKILAEEVPNVLLDANVVDCILDLPREHSGTRYGICVGLKGIAQARPEMLQGTEAVPTLARLGMEDQSDYVCRTAATALWTWAKSDLVGRSGAEDSIAAWRSEVWIGQEVLATLLTLKSNPENKVILSEVIPDLMESAPGFVSDLEPIDMLLEEMLAKRRLGDNYKSENAAEALVRLCRDSDIVEGRLDDIRVALLEALSGRDSHLAFKAASGLINLQRRFPENGRAGRILIAMRRALNPQSWADIQLENSFGVESDLLQTVDDLAEMAPDWLKEMRIVPQFINVILDRDSETRTRVASKSLQTISEKDPSLLAASDAIGALRWLYNNAETSEVGFHVATALGYILGRVGGDNDIEEIRGCLRRVNIGESSLDDALRAVSFCCKHAISPRAILMPADLSDENRDTHQFYLAGIAGYVNSGQSDRLARRFVEEGLLSQSFMTAARIFGGEGATRNEENNNRLRIGNIQSWDDLQALFRNWRAQPLAGHFIMRRIIVTMRLLRQGVQRRGWFRGAAQVEQRLPALRGGLENLLGNAAIWDNSSLLDLRRFLKSINLGTRDRIEEMRQLAIDLITAATGRRGQEVRGGSLVGVVRQHIHNTPSPANLELVRAVLNFFESDGGDDRSRTTITRLTGYVTNDADVARFARRDDAVRVARRLLESVNDVYGDGNVRSLRGVLREWSGAGGVPAIAGRLTSWLDGGGLNDARGSLRELTEIRTALNEYLLNRASTGRARLTTMILDNRLELLFYNAMSEWIAESDAGDYSGALETTLFFLRNARFNGYDYQEFEYMIGEGEELRGVMGGRGRDDLLHLFAITDRIDQVIAEIADQGIAGYQEEAIAVARRMGVDEWNMGIVRNFSSNLFRGDILYLLSLLVTKMRDALADELDMDGPQTIVSGDALGELVVYDEPFELAQVSEPQIAIVRDVPMEVELSENLTGIIVWGGNDSVLSHPAIQARQRGIPFVSISDRNALGDFRWEEC